MPRKKFTKLPPLVIDAGNAWVKFTIGAQENMFVHKVAQLMRNEYEGGLSRYGRTNAFDFVRIDGSDYAIGSTAENYHVQHRVGAPKYMRDYYGVLFAGVIARVFAAEPDALSDGLHVIASHASKDYEFHKQLIDSIKGRWRFECGGVKFDFTVSKVETYEEPFGGYARAAFVKDRRNKWITPLYGCAVGVIDIGGGTCGTLRVDEVGNVNYGSAVSGSQGINNAIERLTSLLKQNHGQFFQRTSTVSEDRVRRTLTHGVYVGGGREIECQELVDHALNPLLNEVNTMYLRQLEGGTSSDVIVLTGGGNAVLHEKVKKMIDHGNVILADDVTELQYANVRGARSFHEVLAEAL